MKKRVNSLALKDEREQLKKRAKEIVSLAKKELRDLTEDEEKELGELKEQIAEKDEELKALYQRLDELTVEDEENDEERECNEEEKPKENNRNKSINTKMEKRRFSIVKAIRAVANNQPLDDISLAVIKEGQEQARKAGISTQGQIILPTMESRATVTDAANQPHVIETDFMDILKPLRAKNVLVAAGAKWLSGCVGNVRYPSMGAVTSNWEAENATAQDGAPTFSHIDLTPKRISTVIRLSRTLIAQDSIGVENAIMEDIINSVNSTLEATILGTAAGSTTQPAGIFNTITPSNVSSFADICDLEADIEDANVFGEMTYVMSNKAKSALRVMPKIDTTDGIWGGAVYENGEVDGTKALNTSHVAGKNFVYGDFSQLAIATWGPGAELIVDPYSESQDNIVKVVCNLYVDSALLRPTAFVTGTVQ